MLKREAGKRVEIYSVGDKNPLLFKGMLQNVRRVVESGLEDYMVFEDRTVYGSRLFNGGNVPNYVYIASLVDEHENEIKLVLIEKYNQPGPKLHYAEMEMKYDPEVSEKDLDIVRGALKKSGLEKIADR